MKNVQLCLRALLPLFLLFTACLFTSCSEKPEPEVMLDITPLVRPAGTSAGNRVSQTIGASGGVIRSSDNGFSVTIPAGALNSETTITIEPVSNTNIAGIGKAYRLTPHGQRFAKPVTLTYSWAAHADSAGLLQTLGLAYQMDDGVWKYVGADSFDSVQKTISFKTSHFSDWSLMNRISLSPYKADLEEGAKQTVKALIFTQTEWDDLLAPLTGNPSGPYNEPGYPVGTPAPLPSKFIKSWELNGPGTLANASGPSVTYQAPSSVNGEATATIALELNAPVSGKFLLLSTMHVYGDGWIELSISGGAPVRFPASPVVKAGSRYLLSNPEDEGGGYFLLTWTGELGSHPYDLSNQGTYFHFLPGGSSYVSRYLENDDAPLRPSEGSVNITKLSGGIVEGTFTAAKVGYGPQLRPQASARGRFRARLSVP